jgi:hypothetical protein
MAGVESSGKRATWHGRCRDCGWRGPMRKSSGQAWSDCDKHEIESPDCHHGYKVDQQEG